jgi:hypothetical protein
MKGYVSSRQRRQCARLENRIGHPIAKEVREIDDFLSEQPALVRCSQRTVGKKIVHGHKPGTSRLAPGRDLYRRGFTGKSEKAMTAHVSDQINQDIYAIGADQFGELAGDGWDFGR